MEGGQTLSVSFLTPKEITQVSLETCHNKTHLSLGRQFVLAILAGAFIAFASAGSNAAIHTITSVGLAKALAGALFATGLIMVLIAGGELFTGNCLIGMSCLDGRSSWKAMLRNWLVVYLGNFVGSMLIVFLILGSGQLNFSQGTLGGFTINLAVYKVELSFVNAFCMGILCNWLVCIAVWMSFGAKDIAGKILAIFFPIWLFVTSGFEHSVANMYYVPAGIFATANPVWLREAIALGGSAEKIEALGWSSFFVNNLIPVTLGNIVGGALFVGIAYWFVYGRKSIAANTCEDKDSDLLI